MQQKKKGKRVKFAKSVDKDSSDLSERNPGDKDLTTEEIDSMDEGVISHIVRGKATQVKPSLLTSKTQKIKKL